MAVKITRTGGTAQVTLTIPASEADAVGPELESLADWFDSALWALALLRTDRNDRAPRDERGRPVTAADLYAAINDMEHRLAPRLGGIRDAAIRRHAELGGSYGQLANAMDVSRSTAQRRRDSITDHTATTWETWATGR